MSKLKDLVLTEYDTRQLNLMKEALFFYKSNELDLSSLISRLRGLLDCLQDVNGKWRSSFYDSWFGLEQVYAVALDRNEPLTNYQNYINNSIDELVKLLE